eukprot:2159421-Amphidinium_carterae.1
MLVVFAATTGAAAGLTQLVTVQTLAHAVTSPTLFCISHSLYRLEVVPGALGCQFLAVIALATILFGLQQARALLVPHMTQ